MVEQQVHTPCPAQQSTLQTLGETRRFWHCYTYKIVQTQALCKPEQTALQSPADGINSLIATASAQTEMTDAMDAEN